MKNSKKIGFKILPIIVLVMVLFSSCVEDQLENKSKFVGPEVETIDDLKVSEFFDWKTTNEVTISIEGLSIDVGVDQKLSLLTGEGTEFFGGSHKMHEDFEMAFDLPTGIDVIIMKYGATEKSAEVTNKVASFTFESEREADVINVEFAELSAE